MRLLCKVLPIVVMVCMFAWLVRAFVEDRPINEIVGWIGGVMGWFAVALYEWGVWRPEDERR